MEFFLDTASLEEINYWKQFRLVDGVTTNPALLSKEGNDPLAQLKKVTDLVDGPVSAQVTFSEKDQMIRQGQALSQLAENIVVKIPATPAGIQAAQALAAEGIRLNVTLGFDPAQAIPFARIPTTYFSLIIGRVEDFGWSSSHLIAEARQLLDCLKSPVKLLAASIRKPEQLRAAISGGADVITVPPSTWSNLFKTPLTLQGEIDFLESWRQLPKNLRSNYEQLGSAMKMEPSVRVESFG